MARDDANNVEDLFRIILEEVPDRIILTGIQRTQEQRINDSASSLLDIVLETLPEDQPNDIILGRSQDRRLWDKLMEASVTAEQNNRFRNGPIITRNDP